MTTSLPCNNKTHCYDTDDLRDRFKQINSKGKETWAECRGKICINRYTFPHYTEQKQDPWAKTTDPNQIRLIVEKHGLSDELRREVEEELAHRTRPTQPKASSSSSTTTQPIASSSTTRAVPASTTPKPQTPRPTQIPIARSASDSGTPTQQPISQQQ
ncbi:hypothetical protein PHLCEN_2v3078 [Hermanssonia centrifuga]|uniref:Uncharacterized protein n=1 Tax=Hermanssonia centrifuga TaxID=98765 RepID=A0A2R6R798_9APHY|nr:hypothetical protein PHLCEN_2v3078 [Hermanssonia centrifuga]